MAKKKNIKKRTRVNSISKTKSNSTKWLVIIIVIIIGIVIGINLKTNTYTFNCNDDKTIKVKFNSKDIASVDLTLNNNKMINLPVTASAGGARYANSDESIVLWNTGDIIRIEEDGQETYSNCVKK